MNKILVKTSVQYHLEELAIVGSDSDPRRAVPPVWSGDGHVLDIGCGIGQTLLARELQAVPHRYGIDPDRDAIAYGIAHFPQLRLQVAGAEHLPFPDNHFDFVYSRVALPYSNLPLALREIHRVLRPGGRVWAAMHPWSVERARLRRALRAGALLTLADSAYVITNSLLVNRLGWSVGRPLGRGHESFQTVRGCERLFARAGFQAARVSASSHLVAEARKT